MAACVSSVHKALAQSLSLQKPRVTPAFRRWRQQDQKLKVILSYIVSDLRPPFTI